MTQRISDLEDLTGAHGAYALMIRLLLPLRLTRCRWRGVALELGLYVYCGSARGPGGIGARVRRHGRPSKVRHWHVDELTAARRLAAAGAFKDGTECDIMERPRRSQGTRIPIPGLGRSDCRHCSAHLAEFPPRRNLEYLLRRLGASAIWLR